MKLLFVGEKRSRTAIERGWTWEDGKLAGSTLRAALEALGVSRHDYLCVNILRDDGVPNMLHLETIRALQAEGKAVVVALGQIAHTHLWAHLVPHVTMVHPAARGTIRKREHYHAHVQKVLSPLLFHE